MIGTHALIEPDVEFSPARRLRRRRAAPLRRRQRCSARRQGPAASRRAAAPHVLHMTATPIPRTLSLTAYGDLDTTTLRELPAGRQPVKTWVVGEEKRAGAYEFVRERLREGRQAFFVCPLVEGSEKLEGKAAVEEAERLAAGELRDFEVALIHGQMHAREKAAAMERVRVRRRRRARGDDRDRGRDRRPERDGDGDRGGRALRPLAAAPAARAGRARRARVLLPALWRHRPADRAPAPARRSSANATASSWPRSTSRCAARARSSAPARAACRATGSPSCPTTSRCWSRRGARCSTGSPRTALRRPRARPAARRRPAALRRRARGDQGIGGRGEGDRRRDCGGRNLISPPDEEVRPDAPTAPARRCSRSSATSRASSVLDLFCGTGALGDRGDLARRRRARPWSTPRRLRPRPTSRRWARRPRLARSRRTRSASSRIGDSRFGLIFCDPPYKIAPRLEPDLQELAAAAPRARRHARARELRARCASARIRQGSSLMRERRYGSTLLRIWRAPSE